MHLTLRFLGEIENALAEEIASRLAGTLKSCKPFTLQADKIELKGGRTLWVSLKESPELSALKEAIDEELENFGIEKEPRPFSPHLTLMRLRGRDRVKMVMRKLKERDPSFEFEIRVDGVRFMESELGSGKAKHSVIREYALKNQ
jgi:2'-5' RNA ligase